VKEQLKGSRWVLVRNQSDRNPEQREKLDTIYAVSPELKLGHQLKEQFRACTGQKFRPCWFGRSFIIYAARR
jgi:hypothetical protein